MLSKKKIAAIACSSILASVVAQNIHTYQAALVGADQPFVAQAQEANDQNSDNAVNPLVLGIKEMTVVGQTDGGNSQDEYTPSKTSVTLNLSNNLTAGDTVEFKLVVTYDDDVDKPLFKNLTPSSESIDLVDGQGNVLGQYKIIDENGTIQLVLSEGFKGDAVAELTFSGPTIDPHSDINARGYSYIRMDAKLNDLKIGSAKFQMSVKPNSVEWLTNATEYTEFVKDEVIPFETERRENPDMLEGQEKIVQEGFEGLQRTTKKQQIVDGKIVGDPSIQTIVAKKPQTRIIEYGTGVEEQVPYKIEYRADETLPFSQKFVVNRGQFGKSVNGKITVEPVTEIVHVGTLREETELIEFNTIHKENPDLHKGVEQVTQEGINGEILHRYHYEVNPDTGEISEDFKTEDVTNVEMVPKIIQVGVGVEGRIPYDIIRIPNHDLEPGRETVLQEGQFGEKWNDEIRKKPIEMIIEYGPRVKAVAPFETERVENKDLEPGEENVLQPGVNGKIENGVITENPVSEIVEHGPEIKPEEIPFETERRPNIDLEEGEEKVVVEGVEGLLDHGNVIKTPINQIVEYGPKRIPFESETTLDLTQPAGYEEVVQEGVEGLIDENGNVLREPINEIRAIGGQKDKVEVSEETTPIPFETRRVLNTDLEPGEEKIIQEGVDGELSSDGNVLKEPVPEIIEYNDATPDEENVEDSEDSEEAETTEDGGHVVELTPSDQQSDEVVVPEDQEGDDSSTTEDADPDESMKNQGKVTTTNVDPLEESDGQDADREASQEVTQPDPTTTSNEQTTTSEPMQMKIRDGEEDTTNSVQEVQNVSSPEQSTNEQQAQTPDQKRDVKTGISDVAVNPTFMMTISTAVGGLLTALGVKMGRGSRKE